ncbi:hypothetical protein I551_7700 [Mycobacterium ulcerans str. Harvey]|uniref:DDE_Tnp_1-associated family protein n=1 Tax=Mycobacterium ulcerans str. Harvey TaxID=1299332 RepID=A0ABN0QMN8_MYCUL|nr:hypothetical protein I551_7700 [Mycobacterium ulcerans str. Harvey]
MSAASSSDRSFSMCCLGARPEDPRGRRYSLMALLAIAVLPLPGDARYAGFATWRHRFR